MDIAGLSMGLAQNRIQTDFGVAMLAKSLDTMEVAGDGIQQLLSGAEQASAAAQELSVTPYLGSNIDLKV